MQPPLSNFPNNPVAAIVARQLEAYNRQDVDAFVACFAEDVVIEVDGIDTQHIGRETMRENYAAMFKAFPNNHATVTQRMVVGQHAVDEELVEGREDKPFRTVAVYTIGDHGLISRVRFLSRESCE